MNRRPSPNCEPRPQGVTPDILVLHYTGMQSAAAALERLCDPEAKVSAHYLIDEDGTITALVDEADRAWHAGVSCWRGQTDVNSHSIGIELVNPGHEFGYVPFSEPQTQALIGLAKDIVARHAIPPRNVVGHSDVAPSRKQDPGELFDWSRLAATGIGLWPKPLATKGDAGELLHAIGYDIADLPAAIAAFQRHYRPARIDGEADSETLALMNGLAALL